MVDKSDSFTVKTKQVERYSDFLPNLDKNPVTGLIARVTDEESIKQSLKNLILTKNTERFYQSYIGSKVNSLMYEPMDQTTVNSLETTIRETINNNEPRVEIVDLQIYPNERENAYLIILYFSIRNLPESRFTFNLILNRVR